MRPILHDRQTERLGVVLLVAFVVVSSFSCHTESSSPESCEQFKERKVSSVPFEELIKRGAQCLSTEDEAVLGRAQTQVLLGIPEGETVAQLLASEKSLESQAATFELPHIPQESKANTTVPDTFDPINPNVQRSPVFIYAAESDGSVNKERPIATGFFVGISATGNRLLRVFVTARHVINRTWADCPDDNPRQVYLRFNLKPGDSSAKSGVAYERLDVTSFYQPEDNNIDVAVSIVSRSMMPNLDKYDTAPIWISLFATDDELQSLKIGDQLYTSGLVPSSAGLKKNNPSFTYVTLSNLPTEPLPSFCAQGADPKLLKVWGLAPNLAEGRSGSPIFKTRNRRLNGTLHSGPVLVGVQSMATKDGGVSGMTTLSDVYKTIQGATREISGLDFQRGFR